MWNFGRLNLIVIHDVCAGFSSNTDGCVLLLLLLLNVKTNEGNDKHLKYIGFLLFFAI